ncbi:MAG: thymidine phosphorylase [Bacteroidota bacterium]
MTAQQEQAINMVTLIRKKRDGAALSQDEISNLIQAYTHDQVPDYQMSAFLMAAFLNGLNEDEAAYLTESMLHSGTVLDFSDIQPMKVDKHSTGGVGDKLSLILAPIVASCGVAVPMISGRGLGHTGGTLDKLESVPGLNVQVSLDEFRSQLEQHNLVMAGQTEDVAPADKRMYSLRDVTATVESIPLIASSIMSKKLAEGIDGLVLDVKFGSGAFMKTSEQAAELAQTLVNIGESFGKETIAYLTNMEEPLGNTIGNWLEMKESILALNGEGPEDVMEITHLLAGTMIYLGDQAQTVEEGIRQSKAAIADGSALEKWKDVVEAQGGDTSVIDDPDSYPDAEYSFSFTADNDGFIHEMMAYELGMASLEMGAGRHTKEDDVDFSAGIRLHKKRGDYVKKGETILTGYTNKQSSMKVARKWIASAIEIDTDQLDKSPLITHRIDQKGITDY